MFAQTDYTFSDGGKKTTYQLSTTEVFSAGEAIKSAKAHADWGGGKVYTMSSASAAEKARGGKATASRKKLAPVFYDKADLQWPKSWPPCPKPTAPNGWQAHAA